MPHSHRAVVTVAMAALYGLGLRPGDRFFCPSSPAWGHGMWHGTVSPLALGVPGLYSRACANQALCEADLVFFIGSHSGSQVTHSYQIPPQGTPIIQLDINPQPPPPRSPLVFRGDAPILGIPELCAPRSDMTGRDLRHWQ